MPIGAPRRLRVQRLRPSGGVKHTSGSVGEQHAQAAVPALGDAPQVTGRARAVLIEGEPEPAGQVARIPPGSHHHRHGREQPNAWQRQRGLAGWALPGHVGEFAFESCDRRLQQAAYCDTSATEWLRSSARPHIDRE